MPKGITMEHIKSEDFGKIELNIDFVLKLLKKAQGRDHYSEISIFFDNGKIYAVDELRGTSPIPRRKAE